MPQILVIDDSADDRLLIGRQILLEHPDSDIIEVPTRDMFDVVLRQTNPALAIVDYSLGWADGISLFQQIREAHPTCSVIMYTGTLGEDYAVEAMKAGLDDYIIKDSSRLPRFRASVRAMLDQSRERVARRQAEASRDLLLSEVYHRVHNNLQIVLGLLRLHARKIRNADARNLLEDLERRIHSLAAVQERLYQSQDFRAIQFGAYLSELAEALVEMARNTRRIATEFDIAPVQIPITLGAPLGLIANELITNAFEHAFTGRDAGTLKIALGEESCAEGRKVRMTVADDGVGMTKSGAANGLGSFLVKGLAEQIGASVARETRPGQGTTVRVEFLIAKDGPKP